MKTSTVEVGGLLSALSSRGVDKRLMRLPGVHHVEADYVAGSATVTYDEKVTDLKAIKAAIEACGYHCGGEMLPKHVCELQDPPASTAAAGARQRGPGVAPGDAPATAGALGGGRAGAGGGQPRAGIDERMAQLEADLGKLEAQMERIRAAADQAERSKLLGEHARALRQSVAAVRELGRAFSPQMRAMMGGGKQAGSAERMMLAQDLVARRVAVMERLMEQVMEQSMGHSEAAAGK